MKPHKWAIKKWTRCEVSAILYDCDVYLGKQPDTDTCKKYGKVGAIVLKLAETLAREMLDIRFAWTNFFVYKFI